MTHKQVSRTLVRIYYTNEVILQVLIFAVVVSLIYQASARMGSRRALVVLDLVVVADRPPRHPNAGLERPELVLRELAQGVLHSEVGHVEVVHQLVAEQVSAADRRDCETDSSEPGWSSGAKLSAAAEDGSSASAATPARTIRGLIRGRW